ncbi:lachesin-like, partial, partial [Argonauta hians]
AETAREPSFIVPARNVTVVAGRKAILPCSVEYLNAHKVIWTNQRHTLLTMRDRRITDDVRMMVVRDHPGEWNLHIRDVQPSDQGQFNCQINTAPVKINKVNLFVLVQPSLNMLMTSQDKTAKEGDTISLVCNVSGTPHPNVTWYRKSLSGKKPNERIGMTGEVLMIHNISRYCNGMYECVADNGVANAVSHLIKVTVLFAPEIYLPTRRIGQAIAKETILECKITAMPQGVTIWKKGEKELKTGWKYRIDAYGDDEYTITLSLRIRQITKEDYGVYTCQASNRLGRDVKSMVLYKIGVSSTKSTTVSSLKPGKDNNNLGNGNDQINVEKSGPISPIISHQSKTTPYGSGISQIEQTLRNNTATTLYTVPSSILILITMLLILELLSGV